MLEKAPRFVHYSMKAFQKHSPYIFILFAIGSLNPMIGYSQSLLEKLGGVTTNFIIETDTIPIPTKEQLLIQRGEYQSFVRDVPDESAGFGLGYQSIHLEFMSTQQIVTRIGYSTQKQYLYVLKFYDGNDQLLALIDLDPSKVRVASNNQEPAILNYSINLAHIPIAMLNKAAKINIIYYQVKKKRR